jgi:hypothetical protein
MNTSNKNNFLACCVLITIINTKTYKGEVDGTYVRGRRPRQGARKPTETMGQFQ